MIIGDHLRALREEKKLSQGDIEKRTSLFRCYISRVENGFTKEEFRGIDDIGSYSSALSHRSFHGLGSDREMCGWEL